MSAAAFAAGRAEAQRTDGDMRRRNCPYRWDSSEAVAWRAGWDDYMPSSWYEGTDGRMGPPAWLQQNQSQR